MIGHKLPNKTKSATVAEPKPFHQLNNPQYHCLLTTVWARGSESKAGQQQLAAPAGLGISTLDGVMECSGQWQG
jgi:hypothetical protein